MAALLNQVFFPSGFQELFTAWSRFPDAVPYAGGTGLIRGQGTQILTLPDIILSLDKIEDLRKITRTERFLEIGAMVRLNQITQLGKIVPEALRLCVEQIANPQLRNTATIGGAICCGGQLPDTAAPLAALDAQFELRNSQTSRWIAAARFYDADNSSARAPGELLCRVRIPLEHWNYSECKKFSGGGLVVFMLKNQKSVLADIRVVYKTDNGIIRDKNSESLLAGKNLPLNRRDAADFIENWKKFLDETENLDEFDREKLLNFVDKTIYTLTA